MKWVSGANQWYKHWSFWGILLLGILPFLEEHLYTITAVLPPHLQPFVNLFLAVIVAVLRFVKQSSIRKEEEHDDQ